MSLLTLVPTGWPGPSVILVADGTSFRESSNLTGLCNCNGNGSIKSQCGWPPLSPIQQAHGSATETEGERKIGRETEIKNNRFTVSSALQGL